MYLGPAKNMKIVALVCFRMGGKIWYALLKN